MDGSSIPIALTIAGSDSGGGAGIQADLRTFAFHQVHGTSALTCITAQNTVGVNRVDVLPAESVIEQISAVLDDIGSQAIKTGMLPNQAIIEAVAHYLTQVSQPIVVDPVMVSRAGVRLIDDGAIASLKQDLIPLATILTPNRYEAEILSGQSIQSLEDMKQAAQQIATLGPSIVVVKGGGMVGTVRGVDVIFDGTDGRNTEGDGMDKRATDEKTTGKNAMDKRATDEKTTGKNATNNLGSNLHVLQTETVNTSDTHGTGCTLSAAIAANLALGKTPINAIRQAKMYVTAALHHSLRIGSGQGPVGHFFPLLHQPHP